MSWYISKAGRAGKLAETIRQTFEDQQGCPKGSSEELAKNQAGLVVETLCKSLPADKVVRIEARGSAWNQGDGTALSQDIMISFATHGDFVE